MKQKGGSDNVNLAIVLITTHGTLDVIESQERHDENINVFKINATRPGVCNYILDDELLDMGNKINKFITMVKEDWVDRGITPSSSSSELTFNTPKISQQQLKYLTQSLRSFLPRIDNVYRDTKRVAQSNKKNAMTIESDYFDEEDYEEQDLNKYRENVGDAYKMYTWKKGDTYIDKTYTIIPEERIDTTSNPYNNTVLLLGEDGMGDLEVVNIPYNLRSRRNEDDRLISLSEILQNLVENGYTDTIIIDLSCSSGPDERGSRLLRRQEIVKYGGKRKTRKHRKNIKNNIKNNKLSKRHNRSKCGKRSKRSKHSKK
jgi:hypothetical protein